MKRIDELKYGEQFSFPGSKAVHTYLGHKKVSVCDWKAPRHSNNKLPMRPGYAVTVFGHTAPFHCFINELVNEVKTEHEIEEPERCLRCGSWVMPLVKSFGEAGRLCEHCADRW